MSTRGGGSGSSSGLGVGTESIDERMQEFISSEITHNILERTPMILEMVNEGIIEILDEHMVAFHTEIMAIVGDCALFFPRVSCLWSSHVLWGEGPHC